MTATRTVLVLNGPNLGRLGTREPDVYGRLDHPGLTDRVRTWATELGLGVDVRHSDDETALVHWLHEAVDGGLDVVLNPAAFTHYSYALRDAAAHDGRAAAGRGAPDQSRHPGDVPAHLGDQRCRDRHDRRLRGALLPVGAGSTGR